MLLLIVLQQIGSNGARIEKLLELHSCQFPNLFFGIVSAALVADARPDLAHDLLDVDVVGTHGEVSHGSHERMVDDEYHGAGP